MKSKSIVLITLMVLTLISCGNRGGRKASASASASEAEQMAAYREMLMAMPMDSAVLMPVDSSTFMRSVAELFNTLECNRLIFWYLESYIPTGGWPEVKPSEGFYSKLEATMPAERVAAVRNLFDEFEDPEGEGFSRVEIATLLERFSRSREDEPQLSTSKELEAFAAKFWKWYDKSSHVPGFYEYAAMRKQVDYPDTLALTKYAEMFVSEYEKSSDIDTKCVLAIELAHLSGDLSFVQDVLSTGEYSKYLLEAYLCWKSQSQIALGIELEDDIPQVSYDYVLRQLAETFCRYLSSHPEDVDARIMLENLCSLNMISRYDESDREFSAMREYVYLREYWYLPPSVLGYDYLKGEGE